MKFVTRLILALPMAMLISCQNVTGHEPSTRPATAAVSSESTSVEPDPFPIIKNILKLPSEMKSGVLTFTSPRDDLEIRNENGDVPTAAGLESRFHFYRCPCGKMNVIGEFLLVDYESNSVMDSLRAADIKIISLGPAMLGENPKLSILRFQGEGRSEDLAKAISDAFTHIGPARMAKQPMPQE